MAKKVLPGGMEGTPSFGGAEQKAVRKFFDNDIIQQYVHAFQAQFGLPRDRLWMMIAQLLVAPKTTKWRSLKNLGRHGMQGQSEPEPRIKELLRYVAATDHKISMPRGRDIVLRSLGATLIYIRSQLPGYTGEMINAHEVELLRYALEHPGYLDRERGITEQMIAKMQADIGHALRITDTCKVDKTVAEVGHIIKAWLPSWAILIQSLPYHWIYYNNARQL